MADRRRYHIQGMRSPLDSHRNNYQKGNVPGAAKNSSGKFTVDAPTNRFPGRYYEPKDTEDI